MHITVDMEKCCASGQCVLTAPDVFDQRDSDGCSYPLRPEPSADLWDSARQAADICPTQAISIQD